MKYAIDKNTGDIDTMTTSIKSLKRKETPPMKEAPLPSNSDNAKLLASLERKIDDKVDEGLDKFKKSFKNEIKSEYQIFTEDCIKDNNKRYINPTIERKIADAFDKGNIVEKNKNELKSSPPNFGSNNKEIEEKCENIIMKRMGPECKKILNEILPECQEIIEKNCTKSCKSIINKEVPNICRDILDTEAQIVCKEIVEKDIEPACKHIMIEEYARTRRNIVEKEIEPACRAIIEEEVPSLCEKLMNKEFDRARDFVLKEEIKPTCKAIINEELPIALKHVTVNDNPKQIQGIKSHEIEPICRKIINEEIEDKCRAIVNENIKHACRNAVKDELESWNEKEIYEQPKAKVKSQSSPRIYIDQKSNTRSAKQLPDRIKRINESVGEESPDALPKHHLPPMSYVDLRSSAMQSEASNIDAYSLGDDRYRYSAEPHGARSRVFNNKSKENRLHRDKDERLKDYLKDKFRPPSDSRSDQDRSSRSLSNSKKFKTPNLKPSLNHQIVSFGRSNPNNEYSFNGANQSSSLEQYSNEKYNFMNKFSDKKSMQNPNFRNSFERNSNEGPEFRVLSNNKPRDPDAFSFERLPKYQMDYQSQNIKPESNYLGVQDVIDENNGFKIRHKEL